MKIIHVINYFQHQLGYQEYFLAKEHAKAGNDVTVITSNKYAPFPEFEKNYEKLLGKREFEPREEFIDGFKVLRLRGIFEQPARRIWLKGLIKKVNQINPDIIISHGESTYSTLVLSILQYFIKYKLVIDSHVHPHDNTENKDLLRTRIINIIFRNIVWHNNRINLVSTSQWNYKLLVSKFKIKKEKIRLINNGSEIERFKPDPEFKKIFRKEIGLQNDDFVIIYTGKISWNKDPLLILKAISRIEKVKNVKLLIIGNIDNDYKQSFECALREHSLNLIHIKAVPNSEIHKFYKISDIACWPRESSLSAFDAISCGLPIIVVKELTDRLANNNGFGIDEGNLEQLSDAIKMLTIDDKLRKNMSNNAREYAVENLGWNIIAQKFLEVN